ncbi:MAG TPA: hypothetical protein VK747_19720 [Blastocatellia bacterium]|nr:hypothetical protein [Blastocatellia bacterium]
MAVIKGVKEKVHLPLYDSLVVKPKEQLIKNQSSNVMRFFQDVTGKTKLQTNMQAASLLPHWNTYEARALRVVISDLAAQFPDAPAADLTGVRVVDATGAKVGTGTGKIITVKNLTLGDFVRFQRRLEIEGPRPLLLTGEEIAQLGSATNPAQTDPGLVAGEFAELGRAQVEQLGALLGGKGAAIPLNEQIISNNGFGNVIGRFIYNTVTTFFVGEKVMIQVPTWFFPAGAGPYSEDGKVTTHGYPNPQATFRFAEPIYIDTQQNFRVEIEIPEADVLRDFQRLYGPLFIWVVIDGFMTRDVQ